MNDRSGKKQPAESGYYVAWTAHQPGGSSGDYGIVLVVVEGPIGGEPYFMKIGCKRRWSFKDSSSWSNKLPGLLGSGGLHRLVGALGEDPS